MPTRWNVFYCSLKRFLKVKEALLLYFAKNPDLPRLDSNEWDLCAAAVSILKPCYDATVEMSGDQYVTGSKVIPMVRSHLGHYAEKEKSLRDRQHCDVEMTLCSEVHQQLLARFSTVEKDRVLALASLMDPRFKQFSFRDADHKRAAISLLKDEVTLESRSVEQVLSSEPADKDKSDVWRYLDNQVKKKVARYSLLDDEGEREVNLYFAEPLLPRDEDPFKWWQTEKRKFKQLSRLVPKYLVVPGTSVPSERVFSQAGNVLTKKRACLNDENVCMLVCLGSAL